MTKNILITDLSGEDRKPMEERLKILSSQMHICRDSYLRDYLAGDQNVIKLLNIMGWVHADIEEAAKELMKVHDLRDFPGFSKV